VLKKVLDVLDPIWMKKILAVSTDGEATMHGIHTGLQTRIDNFVSSETNRHIIRVWCGLHQLDLAAQSGYERLCDGDFLGTLRHLEAPDWTSPKAAFPQRSNEHYLSPGRCNQMALYVEGAQLVDG
jgi:hypothetical protein